MERPSNQESGRESSGDYQPLFSQQIEDETSIRYRSAQKLPSALKALLELTDSQDSRQIGLGKPPMAANVTEQNRDLAEQGLYQEFYPRDAHVSAKLLWEKYPGLTKSTVLACLPYTGTHNNLGDPDWIDEQEFGKIPHQIRDADHPRSVRQYELRKRGYPYYGAVDTTQKNILGIARLCSVDPPESLSFLDERYIDTHNQTRSVAEGLDANVDWVLNKMSQNPEGLVESMQINPRHHANQSWADSPDSFHHADGSLARHHPDHQWGVASVEVNAETYDALIAAAETYRYQTADASIEEVTKLEARIASLELAAAKLKQSIHDYFWVDDPSHHGGYFARGTDRDSDGRLHPLQIRSSDMGHLLSSGVLNDDDPKVVSLIRNLFSPDMLAANGIRTLSSDSIRFDPDAYHNGTVWPWDTYTIARGLDKRGYHGLARDLESRIMKFYESTKTLAEYGSGDESGSINMTRQVKIFDPELHPESIDQFSSYNVIQPPQEIQAWTVAAILAIKSRNDARFRDPANYPDQATDPTKRRLEIDLLGA